MGLVGNFVRRDISRIIALGMCLQNSGAIQCTAQKQPVDVMLKYLEIVPKKLLLNGIGEHMSKLLEIMELVGVAVLATYASGLPFIIYRHIAGLM